MNGASFSIHIQMASFFRFMAANLIFTRLDTWDRPLYSLCAVFGMGAQMAGGTVGTNLEINFIFPVSVPVGSVAGQCFSFSHHSLLLILPHINEKAQLLPDSFDRLKAGHKSCPQPVGKGLSASSGKKLTVPQVEKPLAAQSLTLLYISFSLPARPGCAAPPCFPPKPAWPGGTGAG